MANSIPQKTLVDPIGAFLDMRDVYRRYYNTLSYVDDGLDQRSTIESEDGKPTQTYDRSESNIRKQRDELIEKDGLCYRFPWLEVMPEYQSSGKKARDLDDELKRLITDDKARKAFVELAGFGFGFDEYPLYEHQLSALKTALSGRDVVVTSGTGSGKTEAFLLPLFAQIIKEAVGWPKAGGQNREKWWNKYNFETQKDAESAAPQIIDPSTGGLKTECLQREGERRTSAVRALVLYPMNALVEDQMTRLRRALCSPQAESWFQRWLNGNRIYLGRYNGATPEAGYLVKGDALKKDYDCQKLTTLAQYLKKIDRYQTGIEKKIRSLERESSRTEFENRLLDEMKNLAPYTLPSTDRAEMYCRQDMWVHPPDLLVTNFSMLSIILMRKADKGIFEKTKAWLEESKDHVFQLVLDELHLYRGTPGAETAYLLRLVLDEIGLWPGHEQLRILCSSASLEE